MCPNPILQKLKEASAQSLSIGPNLSNSSLDHLPNTKSTCLISFDSKIIVDHHDERDSGHRDGDGGHGGLMTSFFI